MISSDDIVHRLLREDEEVRSALLEHFGSPILDEEGQVDRAAIARVVFRDRGELAWLERLLHPRVVLEYLDWRDRLADLPSPPDVCATEVPLLYEVGGEGRFDAVVVITAPRDVRARRAGVPLDDRSGRLLPDEEKVRRADYAFVNDGTLERLDAFVAGVVRELSARARAAKGIS